MTDFDIVVNDLQETVPAIRDGIDDLTKGCVIEGLADMAT